MTAEPSAPPAAAAPRPAGGPPTVEGLRRRWSEAARAALAQGDTDLGAALAGARVVALDGTRLTLESDRPMPADLDARIRPYLALLGAAGLTIAVTAPASGAADDRAKRWQQAQAHPVVRDLLKRFEGDVVARELATPEQWRERLERDA